MAKQFKQQPIEVLGIGTSLLEGSQPHLEKRGTAEAIRQVYELTGVKPAEIDLLMANDFVITSGLLAAELSGYIPAGEGWKYILEGRTSYDGDKPINSNGGRTAFGHAFAASGLADCYEAVKQMRRQCGDHQVRKLPETVMLRGFGGGQNLTAGIIRTVQ
jgi:acetyl-CoA C-acetyltransferase